MVKIHSLYVVVKTSFRVQLEFKLNNKDKTKFSLFIYSISIDLQDLLRVGKTQLMFVLHNTGLAARGSLAPHLQCRNDYQGVPKWPAESGKF